MKIEVVCTHLSWCMVTLTKTEYFLIFVVFSDLNQVILQEMPYFYFEYCFDLFLLYCTRSLILHIVFTYYTEFFSDPNSNPSDSDFLWANIARNFLDGLIVLLFFSFRESTNFMISFHREIFNGPI